MKIFITYGDERFKDSVKRICKEAKLLGIFDKVISYNPQKLPKEIMQSPLMCYERGGGYWLWKPYIIWKTMQKYPNAIVVYADAGCTLNKNYNEWHSWFELMSSTDTLFTQYRSEVDYGWGNIFNTSSVKISTWTKLATLEYFDERFKLTEWHDYNKILGGFIMAKNNSSFIREWLDIMLTHPELVRDPEGDELNCQHDGFCTHRHDQSIITPLAYWYEKKTVGIVKIIPETAESCNTAAVVATRIRTAVIKTPIKTRIIRFIQLIIGKSFYKKLHFWK